MSNENRTINRRVALTGGLALPAVALAAPAIAQGAPKVTWRLASSFPKTLPSLFGGVSLFIDRVKEATDGNFNIQYFAPGEIVPPLQTLDAVQNGTVELTHTGSYYFIGKSPAFAFGTQMPFGLNARQQEAWIDHAGGGPLLDEFYAKYNVQHFKFGNTGAQMMGWFRKELKTPEDLKGLKFRIGGIAGQIMAKTGAVPQQIALSDVYQALERGSIDGADYVSPMDDVKLGLAKVAKYYYYPAWQENGPLTNLFVNIDRWKELPPSYQAIVKAASAEASHYMTSMYDAMNMASLRQIIADGGEIKPLPQEIMDTLFRASVEVYEETAAKDEQFKKIYDHWKNFRAEVSLWFSVSETPMDLTVQRLVRS